MSSGAGFSSQPSPQSSSTSAALASFVLFIVGISLLGSTLFLRLVVGSNFDLVFLIGLRGDFVYYLNSTGFYSIAGGYH